MKYKNIKINSEKHRIFSDDGKYWFLIDRENKIGVYCGLTIDEWTNQKYLDNLSQIRIKEVN